MPAPIKLKIGKRYGRLRVKSELPRSGSGRIILCECKCGLEVRALFKSLRTGNTQSCGCFRSDYVRKKNTKHGFAPRTGRIPEYHVWKRMRQRCNDKNNHEWDRYGGRGISVDRRWDDFSVFITDVGRRPSSLHSLDRWPDVNGNYEPGNVRWATHSQQQRNKRNNHFIDFQGRNATLAEWSEIIGISCSAILSRLRRGWSVEKSLTTPLMVTAK